MSKSGKKFNVGDVLRTPGPEVAYQHLGKTKQVPKEVIWQDLCALVKSMPMSDAEIHEMFVIVKNRLPHGYCTVCGTYFPKLEGTLEPALDGDLSKPKRLVCPKHKEKK